MKRAAIIGLGDVSQIHMAAIAENSDITLVGACDINTETFNKVPDNVKTYTDYHEMVSDCKPDCVHVCLPHYLHFPVTRELVEMGYNVFCEKPLAISTVQAKEFAVLEAAHPETHIGICLQNRYNKTTEYLLKLVRSGQFGQVTGLTGFVPWMRPKSYYDIKPWRGRWETAGSGVMMNQSVHTLDLLYVFGGPVKSVKSSVSQILDYGIEVEDTVSASLLFENGAKGLFFATNANFKNASIQIALQMEHGEFRIQDNRLCQILETGEQKILSEDEKMPGSKFYYGASHGKLIRNFYQMLEGNESNYCRVIDAVASIQLIDAILQSSRSGERQIVS